MARIAPDPLPCLGVGSGHETNSLYYGLKKTLMTTAHRGRPNNVKMSHLPPSPSNARPQGKQKMAVLRYTIGVSNARQAICQFLEVQGRHKCTGGATPILRKAWARSLETCKKESCPFWSKIKIRQDQVSRFCLFCMPVYKVWSEIPHRANFFLSCSDIPSRKKAGHSTASNRQRSCVHTMVYIAELMGLGVNWRMVVGVNKIL